MFFAKIISRLNHRGEIWWWIHNNDWPCFVLLGSREKGVGTIANGQSLLVSVSTLVNNLVWTPPANRRAQQILSNAHKLQHSTNSEAANAMHTEQETSPVTSKNSLRLCSYSLKLNLQDNQTVSCVSCAKTTRKHTMLPEYVFALGYVLRFHAQHQLVKKGRLFLAVVKEWHFGNYWPDHVVHNLYSQMFR